MSIQAFWIGGSTTGGTTLDARKVMYR